MHSKVNLSLLRLEDTLVGYIAEWVKDITLLHPATMETGSPVYRAPVVRTGYLPRDVTGRVQGERIGPYPSVLVHLRRGKDAVEEGTAEVSIVCGTWDNREDYQGYRDAITLAMRIRERLWRKTTFDGNYQMRFELEWRLYDENDATWPYFFAELFPVFRVPPLINDSEGEEMEFLGL